MTGGEGWIERPLTARHDRRRFSCGEPELDVHLQRYARQNHENGGAKCFVAADRNDETRILGFYTLSPASLAHARTPVVISRGLGRYEVPVFRLGRLAVDIGVHGRGLGGALLLAAGRRSLLVSEHVGGVALLIDAKNERAAAWYRTFGAEPLPDSGLKLLLPFATIRAALDAGAREAG